MNNSESTLMVVRGPSSAGKTTVAKEVQKWALYRPLRVGQDYCQDELAGEADYLSEEQEAASKERAEDKRIFMFAGAAAALAVGRSVILEGIMAAGTYEKYFNELLKVHPNNNHFFYLDVPFDETVNRHNGREPRGFGEKEMRDWHELSTVKLSEKFNEMIIPADGPSVKEVSDRILEVSGLAVVRSVIVQMPLGLDCQEPGFLAQAPAMNSAVMEGVA